MSKEYDEITIILRDPDYQLARMLDYIMGIANIGHSYEVVVDPESSEYRKSFFIDGDGIFFIKKIIMNNKKLKIKDDKIVEYLSNLQKNKQKTAWERTRKESMLFFGAYRTRNVGDHSTFCILNWLFD